MLSLSKIRNFLIRNHFDVILFPIHILEPKIIVVFGYFVKF